MTDRHTVTVRTMKAVKAALNTNTRQNIVCSQSSDISNAQAVCVRQSNIVTLVERVCIFSYNCFYAICTLCTIRG